MMKHIILCAAALLAAFSTLIPAEAKEKDPESQHVIVTLKSGEKVDGYIRRGWHAESSVFKTENFSFKITKTPDDKEPIEYTADDVESIEYTEVTEDNPDGIRWESHPLAKPNFADRYHTLQRLFCVDKVGENATVYWWKVWAATGPNMARRQLVTYFGVRFHSDPDGIVYPYTLVNSVLMDPKYPGLKDFCKKWFKGPEGKVHKKEAEENDAWILDMYDAYLAQQAAQ
ncbi:hypothetical protein [Millionella massiliensis]|uniref:hypothetical protein n=1 Tax=Millionella massiliensis TaxID=1871023 RepID=UPI0024B76132|nr:hypothetical protein [Millionella massiliensis]